jgi:hypothetical protein
VWQPLVSAPVRWHKFDVPTFEIGRVEVPVDPTHALGLHDAPRSIVDAYRLRRELSLTSTQAASPLLQRPYDLPIRA